MRGGRSPAVLVVAGGGLLLLGAAVGRLLPADVGRRSAGSWGGAPVAAPPLGSDVGGGRELAVAAAAAVGAPDAGGDAAAAAAVADGRGGSGGGGTLDLPPTIRRLHINVGPNTTPLLPPDADAATAVLAVEAQLEIASHLRERVARRYPDRFFVIPAALAGDAQAGVASLRVYNKAGQSASLAAVRDAAKWAAADAGEDRIGRGVEFVPVLSLERLLAAVPPHVDIPLLKTDTQGFDFTVIRSASRPALRRVARVMAEVYRGQGTYALPEGVSNDLEQDWIPHMRRMGYRLVNTSSEAQESDAIFERVGRP